VNESRGRNSGKIDRNVCWDPFVTNNNIRARPDTNRARVRQLLMTQPIRGSTWPKMSPLPVRVLHRYLRRIKVYRRLFFFRHNERIRTNCWIRNDVFGDQSVSFVRVYVRNRMHLDDICDRLFVMRHFRRVRNAGNERKISRRHFAIVRITSKIDQNQFALILRCNYFVFFKPKSAFYAFTSMLTYIVDYNYFQ